MSRDQRLARLLRAVTELSQEEFAQESDLPSSLISQVEAGRIAPRRAHLQAMARKGVGITLSDADEVLRHVEALRELRLRQEQGRDEVLEALMSRLKDVLSEVYFRLLALPMPSRMPRAEERFEVEDQMRRLKAMSKEARYSLVSVAESFQTWALCERICEESIQEAGRNAKDAEGWAKIAQQIAERVPVPAELRSRIQGYAGLHMANVFVVAGDVDRGEMMFNDAKKLWLAGSDPDGLVDSGRRFDLEASLRRARGQFVEALALLENVALEVARTPSRIWISKGFTFEAMGEYGQAVEALFFAAALLDEKNEQALHDTLCLNVAHNFCHLGQHRNAAELVKKVQPRVAERGDDIDLIRIVWLQGRIEAGLGRTEEALKLLGEARERFAEEAMLYEVALALLEEAFLLLGQGRTVEVKVLAEELTVVFDGRGVHYGASALRRFQEAAQQEGATAELAREVLRYLFRARHAQGLRFKS